jgi:carboxyl-terminal processing protease
MIRALLLALAASVAAASCGGEAQRSAEPPRPAEPPAPAHPAYLEAFDYVWKTIDETHWDADKVGEAWDRARAELRPEVVAAATADEARAVINRLLEALGQSHFGIIPAAVYDALGPAAGGGAGTTGLDTRVVDGKLLVVAVEPESPAARAGIKAGWIVLEVGGREVAEVLGKSADVGEGSEALAAIGARRLLTGAAGSSLDVVLDAAGERRELAVELVEPAGKPAQFGHLPTMYVDYRSRKLPSGVGYIRLNVFFDPTHVMSSFARDVTAFAAAPGLILDLRGNPGGLGAMAMGMGGHLIDRRDASLGTMITRDSKLRFVLNPQPQRFTGKVAILVDELCMSTCEILAGGLQEIGRARVFGLRTPGAALPSQIERLPTGDGFQYAIANYVSAAGTPLEGRGVEPDVAVPWEREALLAGRDPALEAALAWIQAK